MTSANSKQLAEKRISLRGIDPLSFYGTQDNNIRILSDVLKAKIIARGNEIIIKGQPSEVDKAECVVSELFLMLNRNGALTQDDIETVARLTDWGEKSTSRQDIESVILYTKKNAIKPRSEGQLTYYQSTQNNDIVFAVGPAGTGKTYLAVAVAISKLKEKEVERIILCRPAVEAGESLGFLPGDLRDKVDPYLRPLYDALYEMVPLDKLKRQLESHVIEIAPLAYMRGRTLNNAFVILDEAQNTTPLQMKMFLTRLGANSKAIITGDITQIDLPAKATSGLVQIIQILQDIEGIDFIFLTDRDVVRHKLVKKIINAYQDFNNQDNDQANATHSH
ncbi:MAG: PhoH family protein [Calditrichaeota bacterium]|nr:PhoH family protein [Calditrichota bacterium]